MKIEYVEKITEEMGKMIDLEFEKYAKKYDVVCNYKPFAFVAKEGEEIIGIITGRSYYKEVHIGDLIVLEKSRKKNVGSMLIKAVEDNFKGKGFENMNLTTYAFQAPNFYKKMRI